MATTTAPSQGSIIDESVILNLINDISANTTALNGKAPISHASTDTSYGAATTSNYGHVRLTNSYTSNSTSYVATQKALYDGLASVPTLKYEYGSIDGVGAVTCSEMDKVLLVLIMPEEDSPTDFSQLTSYLSFRQQFAIFGFYTEMYAVNPDTEEYEVMAECYGNTFEIYFAYGLSADDQGTLRSNFDDGGETRIRWDFLPGWYLAIGV